MYIASFDLETTGLYPDFAILLCAVVKPWRGPAEVYRIDVDGASSISSNDGALVDTVIERLSEFDILIAHNGREFDRKFLNTRAMWHGSNALLDPRGKIIDPRWLAKKHLRLSYNSLDRLSYVLNTKHHKSPVDGRTWLKASLDRDTAALDTIVKHCIGDVLVLEECVAKMHRLVGKINEFGSA